MLLNLALIFLLHSVSLFAQDNDDFYATLGVDKKASKSDIKSAYINLALKYHPDKNPGNPLAEEQFKKIDEAYKVLSDPEQRNRYDQKRSAPQQTTTTQRKPRVPKKLFDAVLQSLMSQKDYVHKDSESNKKINQEFSEAFSQLRNMLENNKGFKSTFLELQFILQTKSIDWKMAFENSQSERERVLKEAKDYINSINIIMEPKIDILQIQQKLSLFFDEVIKNFPAHNQNLNEYLYFAVPQAVFAQIPNFIKRASQQTAFSEEIQKRKLAYQRKISSIFIAPLIQDLNSDLAVTGVL